MSAPPGMAPKTNDGKRKFKKGGNWKQKKKGKSTMGSELKTDFSIPVFQGPTQTVKSGAEGLEEMFSVVHDNITTWFQRQVNRQHYKWAEERLAPLREKLGAQVKEEGLTDAVKAALEEAKGAIAEECKTFASGIVDKIKANEATFSKEEANDVEMKKAAGGRPQASMEGEEKAAFLALPAKDALITLLSESSNTCTALAMAYTSKCGVGFAKNYNRKMNHILREFPESFQFEKRKKSWSLVA